VKVPFEGTHPLAGTKAREHMWVKIDGIDPDGKLVGILTNTPLLDMDLCDGDRVLVTQTEIEAVMSNYN
jgi:hypothetical protein